MEGNELKRLIDRLSGAFLTRKEGVTACRVTNSTTVSVATATVVYVTFDTEETDTSGMHDTGSNTSRITITTPGFYAFGASMEWEANTTGYRFAQIVKNRSGSGVLCTDQIPATSSNCNRAISGAAKFTATDYIELSVYQNSGSTLTVGNVGFAGMKMNFWATRIA